ncbi:NUDIX domain-containing protein [Streptomyces sp. NPDC059740]|uniref:NUDIX domain-containing protein n=1 Tax=Streptomyces sp. NPDC059740 TaxID=3346926 RepID=UPI0036526E55
MTAATADLDVHLILRRGEEVLFGLRDAEAYGRGQWALPCGKVHPEETAHAAAVREAAEELGVALDPSGMRLAHTVQARHGSTWHLGVFYEVRSWTGEPANREPEKCRGLRWAPLGALPQPLMDYSALGLRGYLDAPGAFTAFDLARDPATVPPAGCGRD